MTLRRGIDSTAVPSFLPTFPPRACLIRVQVPLTFCSSAGMEVLPQLHPSALGPLRLVLPAAPLLMHSLSHSEAAAAATAGAGGW